MSHLKKTFAPKEQSVSFFHLDRELTEKAWYTKANICAFQNKCRVEISQPHVRRWLAVQSISAPQFDQEQASWKLSKRYETNVCVEQAWLATAHKLRREAMVKELSANENRPATQENMSTVNMS